LKLGAAGVIPDGAGKGNVSISGTLDINTFSETINVLSGAGTVDTVAGGTPTLTAGANDQTSTFSGVIKNTTGTLAPPTQDRHQYAHLERLQNNYGGNGGSGQVLSSLPTPARSE
jgi:hypothetical protein